MQIKTHRQYDKAWAKLTDKQQARVLRTLKLFVASPDSPTLRVHQLKGGLYPQFSISAGGDLRIHYLIIDHKTIILTMVGTHRQLY